MMKSNRWRPMVAVLALAAASPLAAQATGGTPAVALDPREVAEVQAERARLVARINDIARQLGQSRIGADERRRLQAELETSLEALTALNARVGVDVGTRLMLRRDPDATVVAGRVLGEAQRRVASAARVGYVGITLSPGENQVRFTKTGEFYVRYLDNPSIISVEPGSPAEAAGLRRGDVVLAYDDIDVRREVPIHEVMAPGRTLRMRVLRDGRPHAVDIAVAEAPAYVRGRRIDFIVPTEPLRTRQRAPGTATALAPLADERATLLPSRSEGQRTARTMYRFELATGLAGAQLSPITEGLGAALGVKRGLLVMAVAPRSQADRAGLRDGDIILRADGDVVESIPALGRIIRSREAEKTVLLDVRRAKKNRKVTLTWQ